MLSSHGPPRINDSPRTLVDLSNLRFAMIDLGGARLMLEEADGPGRRFRTLAPGRDGMTAFHRQTLQSRRVRWQDWPAGLPLLAEPREEHRP